MKAQLQKYPFLGYAARYWATHSIKCGQYNVTDLTLTFVKDDRRVSSASQVLLTLDKHWTSNCMDETMSRTPLSAMHFVAYLGHEETISELLSHGFDADAKDVYHRTPLCWAASQGHEAVVSLLLLQSSVNVNSRGLFPSFWVSGLHSGTPLGIAADKGKDKIVKLLIQREDVDVNLPDSDGVSPLTRAVRSGHSTVVELLLTRSDIEINCRNNHGLTPLFFAVLVGQDNVAMQLLKHKDIQVDLEGAHGLTPLACAARSGSVGVMKALSSRSDIEVNAPDRWGQTPLFRAVNSNSEAVVKLLLARSDVDVNWKNYEGRTPLAQAIISHQAAAARVLCAHPDVDLDPRDKEGRDVFALGEEERERLSGLEEGWSNEGEKARMTLDLDECVEILRTAIETRSRKEPQVLETIPA